MRLRYLAWRALLACRCAVRVRAPWAYLANSLRRTEGTFGYRMRAGGMVVYTRHTWLDDFVFDEVFGRHLYRPPPQAAPGPDHQAPAILDLGGHLGFAALYFLNLYPRARITSYEPDPANLAVLRRTLAANGLEGQWTVVEASAGNKSGRAAFVAAAGARSHLAAAEGVGPAEGERIEVGVEDVLPQLEGAEIVKMDIEGGEWAILADERFAAAGPQAVALEFHGREDLEQSVLQVRSLLAGAGYRVGEVQTQPRLGTGTLWAWRPRAGRG